MGWGACCTAREGGGGGMGARRCQWRRWEGKDGEPHDQIKKLIQNLKENPHSRRHIISAWNVPYIENMALPPCHTIFQFYVLNGKLSCQLYQRSADVFLGVPFNIASYALLTMMVAQVCNLKLGDLLEARLPQRNKASLRSCPPALYSSSCSPTSPAARC